MRLQLPYTREVRRRLSSREVNRPETTDETCLYLDLQRSKVLVELALQPESRPKAQKATESALRTDEARD